MNPPDGVHITWQLQKRKCGKARCQTCSQGNGHGNYWYAYWRQAGKLYSCYYGKQQPPEISAEDAARARANFAALQKRKAGAV